MAISFQPLLFSGLTLGNSSAPTIGGAVVGADPNSLLGVDASGNLKDTVLTNGQLLIGSTGNYPVSATLTGTTNQITVTTGAGSITLSLPQSIATTSSPTFANLNLSPSGLIDVTSAGTLAIGTGTASIINIGNSGATVNIQGDTIYQNVTNLNVKDKNITINSGGSTGSASNAGLNVEENAIITGYLDTTADRLGWEFKAPATAGVVTITPGASGFTINQGSHNPVTIGTANGLSLSTQQLSLALSSTSTTGALSSTDWNTFNNKQSSLTFGNISTSSPNISFAGGTGAIIGSGVTLTVTEGNLTESTSSVLTITGGTSSVLGNGTTIQVKQATTSQSGYLTSTDWNTFNGKQAAGNYITALTGDITASGPGSVAATLATVNSTPGSYGSASSVSTFTVNGKGLLTASGSTSIQIAESQVTNLVSDLALKSPIASPTFTGTVTTPAFNLSGQTVSTVPYLDASKNLVSSSVTPTELSYVSGVTSSIQTQLNGKQATGNYITSITGDATGSGPGATAITLATVNSNIGTFNNVTVNAKGLVTAASNIAYLTANQTITLSGDVTGSGTTAITATLATVNSNVGSFGSSTGIPSFTVNAKGLITAASTNVVIAPAGTLTGTTLNSTVVSSSLTSVGTISSGTWNGTTIAIANGGTGQTSKAPAFDALSPMTTAGDVIYGGASGTGTRLGIGSTGQILTVVSGSPAWSSLWTNSQSLGLAAAGSISISLTAPFQKIGVTSSGGAVTLANAPFGTNAPADGTVIRVLGLSSTNTVTINNVDASRGCILNGACTLLKFYFIELQYDNTLDRYVEVFRNF